MTEPMTEERLKKLEKMGRNFLELGEACEEIRRLKQECSKYQLRLRQAATRLLDP